MKELLLKYAQYNLWANNLFIEILLKLEPNQLDKELVSSFRTIKATSYHIWSAEYIWLQRLQLVEHPVWVAGEYPGSFEDACTQWKKASEGLVQFTEKQYDDLALTHVFQFYDLKKVSYKMQVNMVLQHVFNHSASHRGQLVTMLRQVDETKIPRSDFIVFARI